MGLINNRIIGGDVGPGGSSLSDTLLNTQPDDLKMYFTLNESEAEKPAACSITGAVLATEVGGDGAVVYGVDGLSPAAGTAVDMTSTATGCLAWASGTKVAQIVDSSAGWTLAFLCKPNQVNDVDGIILMQTGGATARIYVRMEVAGRVSIGNFLDSGTNINAADQGNADHFEVGTWAWTFIRCNANGTMDLFHNNTQTETAFATQSGAANGDVECDFMRIGSSSTSGDFGDMDIQHVCGWDVPLSNQQIADIVEASGLTE